MSSTEPIPINPSAGASAASAELTGTPVEGTHAEIGGGVHLSSQEIKANAKILRGLMETTAEQPAEPVSAAATSEEVEVPSDPKAAAYHIREARARLARQKGGSN